MTRCPSSALRMRTRTEWTGWRDLQQSNPGFKRQRKKRGRKMMMAEEHKTFQVINLASEEEVNEEEP